MLALYIILYIAVSVAVFFGFAKYCGSRPGNTVPFDEAMGAFFASLFWPLVSCAAVLVGVFMLIAHLFSFMTGKPVDY